MPRNISQKSSLNIQRSTEQRLIDSKIIRTRESGRRTRIIAIAIGLGFLTGGGVLGYLWFSRSAVEPEINRNIILPEDTKKPSEEIQEQVTNPPPPPLPLPPAGGQKFVEVLATETGYLNVRKGPGTNFEKIREVHPGETYELIKEDPEGWYNLRFPDGTTGWVINKYAKIK